MHDCTINIFGNNNILHIKDNVTMIEGRIVICDSDNMVLIGEHTGFNRNVVLDCMEGTQLVIGDNCLFSADIVVRTGDWHSIYDESGFRINTSRDTIIGKHCWIGDRVSITKGVTLADNTVVGTGAVVTKSVKESNTIIVGNPAKIIKKNIQWDTLRNEKLIKD